jgi:hypothetical protein
MAEASVRATGTGSPEPASPKTQRTCAPYATPPKTVAFATRPTPSM